jgi:prepilin-type N-terminal cleavage/methylation domain-containing protein
MIKKLRVKEAKGFTLMEILIVVVIIGLLAGPMFNLIMSMSFSISKDNIKTDMDHKGRTVLEEILFKVRDLPTTDYIEVYDNSMNRLTTAGATGKILKLTDNANQPGTNSNNDIWYRVKTDIDGKQYLLKFQNQDGPNGNPPLIWKPYILIDKVESFDIKILDKGSVPDKLYNKYKINLDLLFGKSQKDKVEVKLDKEFIKYLDK